MLQFKKVNVNSKDHQLILYDLLKLRGEHSISHACMPTFKEHLAFVKNHPYRNWYLIFFNSSQEILGSLYLTRDNCIGLFLIDQRQDLTHEILNWCLLKHKPLKHIPSIRPKRFVLNVSPKNIKMMRNIENYNSHFIQKTYEIY